MWCFRDCKKNENPRVLCIIWYYGNNCTIQYLGCLWTTAFRFFLGVLFVQSVVKEWFPLNLGMCRRERLLGSGESDAQLALAGWVLRLRWWKVAVCPGLLRRQRQGPKQKQRCWLREHFATPEVFFCCGLRITKSLEFHHCVYVSLNKSPGGGPVR